MQSPADPERFIQSVINGLALLLALVGQFALYLLPSASWLGVTLSLVALAVFLAGAARRVPTGWKALVLERRWLYPVTMVIFSAALAVTAAVLALVFERLERVNYVPVLALSVFSGVMYVAAFITDLRIEFRPRQWLNAHRREAALIGLITLAAAGLRFYQLGDFPRIIDGDEGLIGQAALATGVAASASPYAWPAEVGGFYIHAIRNVMDVLGRTPLSLRLLPALAGTLAVPAVYLLGRRLFSAEVGLFAAAMLALSHGHLHFSRVVSVVYIVGTLVIPVVLYLVISGLERSSRVRLALAGLLLSIHFSIYFDAYIIAGALLVFMLVVPRLCRPPLPSTRRQWPIFWLGLFLGALPQLAYLWYYPYKLTARFAKEGTFQSGWLAQEMTLTGKSAVAILAERVAHAFLSLNSIPAFDFYGANIPLLSVFTSAFFLFGLGYALWKIRDYRFLLLNAYLWSITFAIGLFAIPPSADSYRMLAALPAAVLLAAVGLQQVFQPILFTSHATPLMRYAAAGLLLLTIGAYNTRAYFNVIVFNCAFGGDPQTRFSSYLGRYLKQIDREEAVYLLSTPNIWYGVNPSVDFLSGGRPVENWDASLSEAGWVTTGVILVAPPERADELREWSAGRPGGQWHSEYDCDDLVLLAYRAP